MASNDGALVSTILGELKRAADEEAQRILAEAEERARRIVEEARARAEAIRAERARLREGERRRRLALKLAELRAKYLSGLYGVAERVAGEVMAEALEMLLNNPEFRRLYVENALKEALRSLSSKDLIIEPCRGSEEFLREALSSILMTGRHPGVRVAIEGARDCRCGFVARSADGHEIFNATIEAKLSEVKEHLLAYAWKILREEGLWPNPELAGLSE